MLQIEALSRPSASNLFERFIGYCQSAQDPLRDDVLIHRDFGLPDLSESNSHEDVIKMLPESVAVVDTTERLALHVATELGHADTAQRLLEAKGDVMIQSEDGHTALHLASQNGHAEVVNVELLNFWILLLLN